MTLTMSSFDDMGDDDIFYSDEESDVEIFKVSSDIRRSIYP